MDVVGFMELPSTVTHSSQPMESAAPLLARASAMDSGDGSPDLRRPFPPAASGAPTCCPLVRAARSPGLVRPRKRACLTGRWPVCHDVTDDLFVAPSRPCTTNLALGPSLLDVHPLPW